MDVSSDTEKAVLLWFSLVLCAVFLLACTDRGKREGQAAEERAAKRTRVLLRETARSDLAADGLLVMAEVYLNLSTAPPAVFEQILLSGQEIDVTTERKSVRTGKEAPKEEEPWKQDTAGFDFLVRAETEAHQPRRHIADPTKIEVKETWTVEKLSDPQVTKSWTTSYELVAEVALPAKNEGEIKIAPARGPILKGIRAFIRANQGQR